MFTYFIDYVVGTSSSSSSSVMIVDDDDGDDDDDDESCYILPLPLADLYSEHLFCGC